jgi:hypothetical protein
MQQNLWQAMMESVAVTPWLKGKMRYALEWGSAPELINGVPLQSGQWAARRLKKAMIHIMMLNPTLPSITCSASWLGALNNKINAVNAVINPRKYNAEKKAATW